MSGSDRLRMKKPNIHGKKGGNLFPMVVGVASHEALIVEIQQPGSSWPTSVEALILRRWMDVQDLLHPQLSILSASPVYHSGLLP